MKTQATLERPGAPAVASSDLLCAGSDFQIVKVHPHLITYVDSLQKKNAEALSFYPKCVFERESEKGRILLGLLNGDRKKQTMKTLKLTGNFDLGHRLNEACESVEAARSEMDAAEYGSQEYFDALKVFKSAQAEHTAILKGHTDAKAHNDKVSHPAAE